MSRADIYIILDGLWLITGDIAQAQKNTARVKGECSILLGKGDIVCYQPKEPSNIILFTFNMIQAVFYICTVLGSVERNAFCTMHHCTSDEKNNTPYRMLHKVKMLLLFLNHRKMYT